MSYRVMKFGGSSVGTAQRLYRVTDLVARERAGGHVAVVVSAMGDTTDWLIEAADLAAAGRLDEAHAVIDRVSDLATTNGLLAWQELSSTEGLDGASINVTPTVRKLLAPLRDVLHGVSLLRERTAQTVDLIMSFGERLSATVLAALLDAKGVPAVYVDARTWTVTDDRFGAALVDWDATRARLRALSAEWGDCVPVTTGFLGQTPDGRTTTLGRNGSDYTATLLARGLDASEVVIWTDVSGVMTADPTIVGDAYPIERLSYSEALELANFGARMFHPRTMIPLIESSIPMRIRNTMAPDAPGTAIDANGASGSGGPISVTSLENLALIDVRWRQLAQGAQMGRRVLRALETAGVTVWMASQSAHGQAVAVVTPVAQLELARRAIDDELLLERERGDVEAVGERHPVTLLSLVAEKMEATSNVSGQFFDAVGAVGVEVRAIAQGASSRSISCVIDAHNTPRAVRSVHAAFNFAHQQVSLLILGKGTVGAQLLAQIDAQRAALEADHDVALRVVGLVDSHGSVFSEGGLDVAKWSEALDSHRTGEDARTLLDRLRGLPVPILVDCTAADGMEALYLDAFERGVHVVAANKKPLTIEQSAQKALMAAAREHHSAYHYETTVGASLPVIDTLKNLVRTGDHVRLVEGSFSGTLGYLTNELMAGVRLSDAVRTAKRLGYTEPNPQDDLSGMDVVRKGLILARELGLDLELDDVEVEPLVAVDAGSIDDFFTALEANDDAFAEKIATLIQQGRTLRYLARIDPSGATPAVRVGPVDVPADHPATHLKGSEAFVAFTTERYRDRPLLVQGSGAGGAVTAAGVLADVLRIAQTLRGR